MDCGGLTRGAILSFLIPCVIIAGCNQRAEDPNDPSPAKSPQEESETFRLEDGLEIQLVASEPMVQDPVVITFDESGRLWVVEMRGFMPDVDGKGEDQRVGRVSVLEDTDYDGVMDKSTTYIDSLLLPRAVAVVKGGALVVENQALWLAQDRDGDLHADSRTLIDPQYAGAALVEHSGNGLWRGLDNWYYNAKSHFRYKPVNGSWTRDTTEFRGQWGISHDNKGRLYYNYNWSQLHADLVPPNYFFRNAAHIATTGIDHGLTLDRRVYPIRPNPAVNRGYIPGTLDEKGRLREFTAACAPFVYRGDALPAQYSGNAFVCEPSGNLVKRNLVIENKGTLLSARDPHPGREFLASTDERFRPVFLASGPDGALYLADMYRGLVQHGKYVTPYLREQTIKRKLEKPINCGRIWRIVPKGWKPSKKNLGSLTSQQLVRELSNSNGWTRDMAQRLLVERADTSVATSLYEIAVSGADPWGRLQALWVLEGLGILDSPTITKLIHDQNTTIRNAAIRLSEPRLANDPKLKKAVALSLLSGGDNLMDADLQSALTAGMLDEQDRVSVLKRIVSAYDSSGLMRDAVMSSLSGEEMHFLAALWTEPSWQTKSSNREIFLETLSTAIAKRRVPKEISGLLALAASDDWRAASLITGITMQGGTTSWKPIHLGSEPTLLVNHNIPAARVAVLRAMFEWPGHKASPSPVATNGLKPGDLEQFALGRQHYLSTCSGCHGTDGSGLQRFGPPLAGSEWVTGDERRLALIILHGIEGPLSVQGKRYDEPEILPVMPAHSTMDDGAITAILTYIRNEWGNHAGAMNRRTVGSTRHTTQGRVMPWTADELNRHIEELKSAPAQ